MEITYTAMCSIRNTTQSSAPSSLKHMPVLNIVKEIPIVSSTDISFYVLKFSLTPALEKQYSF